MIKVSSANKKFIFKVFLIIFLITAPWFNGIFSESINPEKLVQEDMSFYEINPCKVSLSEFLINDPLSIFQDHYHFRFNNYSSIGCFGKISGATLINNEFYISIGTNSFINLVLQLTIWTLLFSFIRRDHDSFQYRYKLLYLSSFFTACIFTVLIFSEKRYYAKQFYLMDMEESYSYFYILSILVVLVSSLSEVISKRVSSLPNYLPYIFLLLGVFSGFNINLYSIIVVNFGLYSLLRKKFNIKLNILMLLFTFFWISNADGRYSFDPDKLRGFTSTSYELMTIISMSLFFIFFVNGLIYLFNKTKGKLDINLFFSNLCKAGFFILTLGIVGSNFPIINFLNYYYFGQQKYGITLNNPFSFDEYGLKIPWRGFYPSAESIGEFFGLVLFFSIIVYLKNKSQIKKLDLFFILYIIFGLYFTNNRSVMILLVFILLFFFKDKIISSKVLFVIISLISAVLVISTLGFQNITYPYSFSSGYLLELANNYSDGYEVSEGLQYANKLNDDGGIGRIIFGFFSFIAFYLNRSQIWAYSLGRYNPDFGEVLIGTGPYNIAKHYAEINLLTDTLLLPHSTVLTYLLFFGVVGVCIIFSYLIYFIVINKSRINFFGYSLILFLALNIIKNDSMLYPSGFIFYTFLLYTVFNESEETTFTK